MAKRGPKPKQTGRICKRPLKRRKKRLPANKYMRGTKLSEAQFLAILRGFADDQSIKQIASKAGTSELTTRKTIWLLRQRLYEIVLKHPRMFGGIHRYLFSNGQLLPRGERLLSDARKPNTMAAFLVLHNMRHHRLTEMQFTYIAMEITVRTYARMIGHPKGLHEHDEVVSGAYKSVVVGVLTLLDMDIPPDMMDEAKELMAEAACLADQADAIRQADELDAIRMVYRPYGSASNVIFNDMKAHCAKLPLER